MGEINAEELLSKVAGKLSPDTLNGINGTLQLELTGEKTGVWHVVMQDGKHQVFEGKAENPTLTLSCDYRDFAELIAGRLDVMRSFMTGKLKISGDMSLAMKLVGKM